jgi:DNA-directed RNA polymerase subunit RPC12/RpoP
MGAGGSSHPPAGNAGKKRRVHIDGLVIFVNKCTNCGDAFSVNVKDLDSGKHTTTVCCPYCGVWQTTHSD